jgi:hypothetical protein
VAMELVASFPFLLFYGYHPVNTPYLLREKAPRWAPFLCDRELGGFCRESSMVGSGRMIWAFSPSQGADGVHIAGVEKKERNSGFSVHNSL